jgi:hypothetical protein
MRNKSRSLRWLSLGWFWAGLLLACCASASGQEMRTWKDTTGRFTIKAKLLKVEKDVVKLQRDDGQEIEIPLDKLSKEDRDYLTTASDSPFKPSDSPFKPAKPGGKAGKAKESDTDEEAEESGTVAEARTVEVDWSAAEIIPLTAPSDTWQLAPPAPLGELDFKPRTIALPAKKDFFEGLKGLALNAEAKKAVVGYVLGRDQAAVTRLVLCDLKTGKAGSDATGPGSMAPIALHDDGHQVVMRRDDFGFGNQDRLEVWKVSGKKVTKSLTWIPYDDVQGAPRDVLWAEFLDAEHLATCSRGGKLAIWKFATAEPLCYLELTQGSVPALSADRKLIAFCTDKNIGVFDVDKREVVALAGTPRPLQWPYVAWSPSGGRIGCIAFNSALIWDAATGQLLRDIPCTGINVHGAIAYPADSYLLGGNAFLLDVDNQLKLWQYNGIEQLACLGQLAYIGTTQGDRPGALVATKLPHPAALDLLKKALQQPDMFVFHEGSTVRLNVDRIQPAQQGYVVAALTKKLESMGCHVAPNGTIDVVAFVEGPKQREVSYMHSGDYKVQEYVTSLSFVYQGQVVWQTGNSSVPGMIMLKDGENVEGVLRASERPGYEFYERVELPKFLQKPTQGQGPNSGQTLGQSTIAPSGVH